MRVGRVTQGPYKAFISAKVKGLGVGVGVGAVLYFSASPSGEITSSPKPFILGEIKTTKIKKRVTKRRNGRNCFFFTLLGGRCIGCSDFPDDRDFYLPRVFGFLFKSLGNIVGNHRYFIIVNLVGVNNHPDIPSSLEGHG